MRVTDDLVSFYVIGVWSSVGSVAPNHSIGIAAKISKDEARRPIILSCFQILARVDVERAANRCTAGKNTDIQTPADVAALFAADNPRSPVVIANVLRESDQIVDVTLHYDGRTLPRSSHGT